MATIPPSPDRPGPQRTVTAPELANALARVTTTDRESRFSTRTKKARKSSEGSNTDHINDLGIDRKDHYSKHDQDQATDLEAGPSTSSTPPILPTNKAWQTYFMQEVAGDKFLELQLLVMTVVTGMLDAMTYTTYNVFASKQTGNTLFLALYAFRLPTLDQGIEKNVGVSIGVFIAGAVFFGHIGHVSRQRRRVWLLISNAFQALLMLAAAAIRYWNSRESTGSGAMAILAVLSFSESGQIANALNVSMPELNTTMITGALIQLCTDRDIFKLHNVKRNRRLAFFASMLLGCFLGSAVLSQRSPSAVLVVVAGTKGALVLSFFLNRGLVEKKLQAKDGKEKIEGTYTPASNVLWGEGTRTPGSRIIWGD